MGTERLIVLYVLYRVLVKCVQLRLVPNAVKISVLCSGSTQV